MSNKCTWNLYRCLPKTHTGLAAITAVLALAAGEMRGQSILDAGFEKYSLSSGEFIKPTSGLWSFNNDAGIVRPYAPNSSTDNLHTWSATFAAFEGQLYASTYAGSDYLKQTVNFQNPGDYRISVYAAAPGGTVTLPGIATLALVDGEFTFTLGSTAVGSANVVPREGGWAFYSTIFSVATPGSYEVGIRNSKTAPYFINYDAFELQAVPELSSLSYLLIFGFVAAGTTAMARRNGVTASRQS